MCKCVVVDNVHDQFAVPRKSTTVARKHKLDVFMVNLLLISVTGCERVAELHIVHEVVVIQRLIGQGAAIHLVFLLFSRFSNHGESAPQKSE